MRTYSNIVLQGLELSINLGWPKGERSKKQIVMVDITIHFSDPPTACETDQLDDTVCYDVLIENINTFSASKNFRLIEHFGFALYQKIKEAFPPKTRVEIRVTKKPAILNLTGGVAFCFGDQ